MILVTGATGLLGKHLIKILLGDNQFVKALIRSKKDAKKFEKHPNLSFCVGNINDIPSLELAFEDVEQVYHCAGKISFSPFDKQNLFNVNVSGTANIVNFCIDKNVKKLCYVSSVAAIGKDKNSLISTEKTTWDDSMDNSYYGKTKYLGELEVWRGIEEGLNAVITNPSVILGPSEWNQSTMKLFKYVKEGNKFYTAGGNNFIDVRDVVNIMIQLMNSEINAERYILTSHRIEYIDLFQKIAKVLNVNPPSIKVKNWLVQIMWRVEHLKSLIFRTEPLLTKETAKVTQRQHQFSSEKINHHIDHKYHSIDDTINWVISQL